MHSCAFVLIPGDTKKISRKVFELLWPHCEFFRVEPYEDYCDCVYNGAVEYARRIADEKVESLDALTHRYHNEMDPDTRPPWEEYIAEYNMVCNEAEKRFLQNPDPDKTCKKCKGRGRVMSRINKNARFDFFLIGGRWGQKIIPEGLHLKRKGAWYRFFKLSVRQCLLAIKPP